MMRWRWRNVPVPEGHVISLALGLVLDRLRPAPLTGRRSLAIAAGGALATSGALLAGWAVYTSEHVDLAAPSRLVTTGPYRYTRNPMYVGWALVSLGMSLLGNSSWMVAFTPIGALASHIAVLDEERDLESRFGRGFRRYATRVPRYL